MRPLACVLVLLAACGSNKPDGNDGGTTSGSTTTSSDPTDAATSVTSEDPTTPAVPPDLLPECPDPNSDYHDDGKCYCDFGHDWCVPDDPDDLSCCPADTPTPGESRLCIDFCDRLTTCGLDGAFDGCPCFGPMGPKCTAAWEKTLECFNMASCAKLEDGTSPCWTPYENAVERCILGEDGCDVFILGGGDPPPGTCTFGEDCLEQPEKLVQCDANQCTCTIDDVEVGTCPADGVCDDFDLIETRIAECCGAAPDDSTTGELREPAAGAS